MKEIPISGGYVAIVDDEDYERLKGYPWRAAKLPHSRTVYARRWKRDGRGGRPTWLMHREVMGVPRGTRKPLVDHINGNGLDNRKCNLRLVSERENKLNTDLQRCNRYGFRGITLLPNGKFRAVISVHDRKLSLGCHDSAEDAAKAYDEAAIRYNGAFARLNFPNDGGPDAEG